MRRVLFATVVVAMLLGSVSSVFAAEPVRVEQVTPALLGDVWCFYADFGIPFDRVDTYLYRPSTLAGWPFPTGPDFGTWWWTGPDSTQRRQSWPSYQYADVWGWYYAEFMFPRDNVWYPCGFPLQWQCNYAIDPVTIEWHSPAAMVYECRWLTPWVMQCLDWPWEVEPCDTVSPMEVYLIDQWGGGFVIPFEVLGMYWKFSDFE